MTAMIDMAFLLITFFVMSIRLGQQGEELVKLPRADQASAARDERVELLVVNVTRDGSYLVGGNERSPGDIVKWIGLRKADAERIELVIRGDRDTPFESIRKLMRLAAEEGVSNVSLAALKLAEEEP
ncbi:MAG: biopolymer transporter ExbD [Deltaproteobacteria bacterium]|nr:MAG: biopolymer transporter ExbD [Deltaproteobacteria bacterium]